MPSDPLRNALYDMRDNIVLAREFVAGLEYSAFVTSRRDVYAVTRAIEILSEASKRLPDEVRARHPGVPWRDIRDVATCDGRFLTYRVDSQNSSLRPSRP